MSLITEQNIDNARLDTSPPAVNTALKANAGTATPTVTNEDLAHTVAQLGRETAEMQVQLHNLRTELARSSAAVSRSAQRTGVALILALIAAAFWIGKPATPLPGQADGMNEAVELKLGELETAINGFANRLENLNASVVAQKQVTTQTLKATEPGSKVARASDSLDCAKLTNNVKASEADFSIQFQSASAKILPGSEATLDGIAKMLALVPTHCVIIEGHADASGNTAKNIALSKERANSVLDYIATKSNLNRSQLVAVGKGSSNPPAGTDALDPANRRVVFKVVPPGI